MTTSFCPDQLEVRVASVVRSTLQPEAAATGNWVAGAASGSCTREERTRNRGRGAGGGREKSRGEESTVSSGKKCERTMRSPVDIATVKRTLP